ncbi:17865_t:CDS:2 [Cetraspora pellucida]|uniref:17865_t:CDS:1 n=1 Tax=Cetraspora pellucida TaxID=1433469 RepID=A0ACA9KLI6_9GLOM|nr:17865_t:CDS:2 [Cetraspora pellucida]
MCLKVSSRCKKTANRRIRKVSIGFINYIVTKQYEHENRRSIAQQQRRKRERTDRLLTRNSIAITTRASNLYDSYDTRRKYFGHMNVECIHCKAFHWLDERLTKLSSKNPRFGKCCQNKKVILSLLHDPSLYLKQLFECDDDEENRLNKDLSVYLHYNDVNDKHCYNLPTANEIAVILPGDELSPEAMHDIIIRL